MTAPEHENIVCPAWHLMAFLLVLTLQPTAQARAADTDPFPACMAETDGDDTKCLARQGDWASWTASETACRFVGKKVDAIVEAGGQPKWADLLGNERCARLGLPYGPVTAAAGDRLAPNSAHARCIYYTMASDSCREKFGRHTYHPVAAGKCELMRDLLRGNYLKRTKPASIATPFRNERCWRLGYPHFEPD